ncbi:MAG: cytochrome c oxidase subunit 2A [Deinococcales bacterium]
MSEHDHDDQLDNPKHQPQASSDYKPTGAVAVTIFLAVVILITWFSIYALNAARS